jgi:hypothetical protein
VEERAVLRRYRGCTGACLGPGRGLRLRPRLRGKELLEDAREGKHLHDALLPAVASAAEPREQQSGRARSAPGSRTELRQPLRQRLRRMRGRCPAVFVGPEWLWNRQAGPVHGAQRRHALRPRLGNPVGTGAPAGHRDHQRLGPGRRADVLVRGADARQGRLRGDDLRSAGPGPIRHLRRGRRPPGGSAGADRRPAVLRSSTGSTAGA